MTRFRGKTLWTIVLTSSLILLAIIYHILSNEVEQINPENGRTRLLRGGDSMGYSARLQQGLEGNNKYDDSKPLFTGHKIVHLDLKGAPFKVTYYDYLFELISTLGGTGLLVEYEDMFPFRGDNLGKVRAGNSYTPKDIRQIQETAEKYDLTIIPLVQTFGHFEFVLKLDTFKDYREVFKYPQVLCPTFNGTMPLIREMIDQVVKAHPKSTYIHVGADEVYHLGECWRCLDKMRKNQWTRRQLFLDHVTRVVKYVRKTYPHLTILMWDDEFREITPEEIVESGLDRLVEPVVWKYTADPASDLNEQLWDNYANVWSSVWIATAFKGATLPDRYYTNISHHLENHQRWLEIVHKYSDRIKFKGVMLTGWQRYDHFGVLCELLPAAIPSLAVNLAVMQQSTLRRFPTEVPAKIIRSLKCEGGVSLSIPEPQYGWTKCDYHGVAVYKATFWLYMLHQEVARMEQDNTYRGWLKPFNVRYAFSNPSHVEHAVTELDRQRMEVQYIEREMTVAMEDIYDNYTVNEWLETFVSPLSEKLSALWRAKEKILSKTSWPARPFNVKNEL